MTVNPYQPTPLPDLEDDPSLTPLTELHFGGVIERKDYESMLPNRRFLLCLQAALLVVMAPTLLLVAGFAFASTITDGADLGALFAIIGTGLALAFTFWGIGAVSPKWRSRKYLAHFPDLLGVARGAFNHDGLLMHDGLRTHWFGPTFLSASKVFKTGIRVPLPGSPYRYLAFTRRIFDAYSLVQANQLHGLWREKATGGNPADAIPIANVWTCAVEPPEDAVAFKGYLSQTESLRTDQTKQQVMSESFGFIAILIAAVLLGKSSNPLFWGAILFLVVSGFSTFTIWRQYLYGTVDQNWFQYGWISATQIAICNNEIGTLIERSEIASVESCDQYFSLTTHANTRLFIFREQVSSDTAWQRLAELLTPPA